MISDPYAVLGAAPNASAEEIKKAYRRRAKEYHPDLHPNDPAAAKKMNEVNEAYDMLTNPEKYAAQRQRQQPGGGTGAGSDPHSGSGSRQGPGGWASDFGGFGFDFDNIFGFGFGQTRQQASTRPQPRDGDSREIQFVVSAINSGRYQEALRILTQIPSTGRNARWYYLAALAGYGMGNTAQAEEQMRRAVQLDPNNREYHALLQQFRQAEQNYTAQRSPRGFVSPFSLVGKVVLGMFAARFLFGLMQMLMYSLQYAH